MLGTEVVRPAGGGSKSYYSGSRGVSERGYSGGGSESRDGGNYGNGGRSRRGVGSGGRRRRKWE